MPRIIKLCGGSRKCCPSAKILPTGKVLLEEGENAIKLSKVAIKRLYEATHCK